MRAMILAAGLGTRLRPLTNDRPKALVEIAGRSLLEITLNRLRLFGIHDMVINAHHFADKIIDYLRANNNFGCNIEVSREEVLLDTGGGLKKAAHFFLSNSANANEPFLLHNVDVISTLDFQRMVQLHRENRALATLAVQDRPTSRHLLFDENLQLCGRQIGSHEPELVRPSHTHEPWAFSGIHVVSPRLLAMLSEQGTFSIITSYLRLAGQGENILAFRAENYYWRDVGTRENVQQAGREIAMWA